MPLRPITLLPCLLLSLALGGCFAAGPGSESSPELAAAQANAAPQGSATSSSGSANPMPAGRAATAPKPPPAPARTASAGSKEEWWKEGGVTREKINGMCWMKAEGQRGLTVDKRAEFVDRCVAETLKEYPVN